MYDSVCIYLWWHLTKNSQKNFPKHHIFFSAWDCVQDILYKNPACKYWHEIMPTSFPKRGYTWLQNDKSANSLWRDLSSNPRLIQWCPIVQTSHNKCLHCGCQTKHRSQQCQNARWYHTWKILLCKHRNDFKLSIQKHDSEFTQHLTAKGLPKEKTKFKTRLHSADKAPAMIRVQLGLGPPWIRSEACDHNIQAFQVQLEIQGAAQNLHNELSVSGRCHQPANSFNKVLQGVMNNTCNNTCNNTIPLD